MACNRCTSENQTRFNAEMILHSPGLEGLNKPTAWVFPAVVVCSDCGFAEFIVPEAELRKLLGGQEPDS